MTEAKFHLSGNENSMRFQDAMVRLHFTVYLLRHPEIVALKSEGGGYGYPGSPQRMRRSLYASFLSAAYACKDTACALISRGGERDFRKDTVEPVFRAGGDPLMRFVIESRHAEDHRAEGANIAPLKEIIPPSIVGLGMSLSPFGIQSHTQINPQAFRREPIALRPITTEKGEVLEVPTEHRGDPVADLTPELLATYCGIWWSDFDYLLGSDRKELPPPGLPLIEATIW